ncbi:Macrolide export ATP-binding/permease protein MacB [Pseudovibrio axinellae]|uniref:Macrolide export ATP-binding/permease protein MacB n=1 Tax=Pseudovibrio axinellae TaxID=989403 RepID=A0A165WY89_9HYPH|nr:ABC transporter permease [Pseudovibrio axinellae]KZL17032.1 Macrolide export ATP-binding/permease protein MacB [Pseudovibrio axinellae]SEQ16900.1 putative ABC transport system permease protein [Pseudovibrio axinellae]
MNTDNSKGYQPGFRLAARFALREMRGGLRGFYVFIACIALGVAAIGGVASFSRGLTEGISAEGQAILGGDLSFSLVHRQANPEQLAHLQSIGDTSRISSLRAMARTQKAGNQTLVELKAVDDPYPLVGDFDLASGKELQSTITGRTDGLRNAVAEVALLARLGLNIGDKISVGKTTFNIADTIELEPDKLSSGMTVGPRLLISQAALADTGLIQPGSLVNYKYRVNIGWNVQEDQLQQIIDHTNELFPNAGWRIRSKLEAAPSLQRNIQRFAQFLTLIGITSLVVGGVGVANAVRSYMDTRREVIASFKCLGASGGFVFKVYLIQMMVLATIGIGIGMVLGALIPLAAMAALQSILPINAVQSVYPLQLLLGMAYGYLTALTFALWPLGRAHDIAPTVLFRDEVSTRNRYPKPLYIVSAAITLMLLAGLALVMAYDKSIAMIFIGACAGTYLLLLIVARLIMAAARRVPTVHSTELRLAITNIYRPGALTPSIVLSLGLGLSLLVALALIDGNLRRELNQAAQEQAPSFFFVDIQNHEKDAFQSFITEKTQGTDFNAVPMLRGNIVSLRNIPAADYPAPPEAEWILRGDRGITYSDSLPETSKITEGTWWPEDYSGEPLVSFADDNARELGLSIGDKVTINVLGRQISAKIANFRTVNWESMSINFVMVFSPNTFAGAPHTHLATVAWPGEATLQQELDLLKEVTQAFPTITSIRVKDAIAQVNELVGQLAWAIRGASSITLLASVLVLAGALAAGHQSRIYDAVILKTLGATRGRLIKAYVLEYLILGGTTAIFALFAGSLAAYFIITGVMDGTFALMPMTAVASIVGALVFTVGFGLLGTWRILGEKPAPVLRNL